MEIKGIKHSMLAACVMAGLLVLLAGSFAFSQQKVYTIKDGKMLIMLPKDINEASLDSFIIQFDLSDLDLKNFFKTGINDSLRKLGWIINQENDKNIILTKQLLAIDNIINPGNKINFNINDNNFSQSFPAVSNKIQYGANQVKNRYPFFEKDSTVRFFLRGQQRAGRVMLAGSFNNWSPDALSMTKTDSGWIADVKLLPGKYWYKFIADGNWMTDPDNRIKEHDGEGNDNSVYYRTNIVFRLDGFEKAKQVYLAGSFNNWEPKKLAMQKTADGWEIPVYLADGTHTYKFVVNGKSWLHDEKNPEKLNDGSGGFNSVIKLGKPYLFKLNGFEDAKQVMVVGSFNQWRDFEWSMKKNGGGWELPLVLSEGNHEYKFKVDDQWISDPANPIKVKDGNSFLVIKPNYTFRLKGFAGARTVLLAGDFNSWDPNGLPMEKDGNDWVFSLHLAPGKVRYKFIVDGNWIVDPTNKQWEENEYGTGNSVIWIEN